MKTSRFSFPRRVRIHGGECGAVARALHHAAQKEALMPYEQVKNSLISDEKAFLSQADSKKAFGSTFNERKQMSTKTSIKRIALVAVSALGFGLLSVAPSGAADSSTTVSTFTSSLSLRHTSATVVGYDDSNKTRSAAIFQMTAIGNNGQSSSLFSGETITATVTGVPAASAVNTAPAASQLTITPVKVSNGAFATAAADSGNSAGAGSAVISAAGNSGSPDNARLASGTVGTNANSVYYFAVSPAAAAAVDAGVYTIRIRLTDITGFSTNYNVTVNFVTSAADSGAVITPTVTGTFIQGQSTLAYTSTRNMQAVLTNASGGRLFVAGTTAFNPVAPVLSAALTTSAGVARAESLTIADSGTAAVDRIEITAANTYTSGANASVTVSAATRDAADALNRALDGTYGITSSSTLAAPTATGDLLRVRYGSTSATAALTIVPAATAGTFAVSEVTGTGAIVGADANDEILPLTTKTATVTNKVTATNADGAAQTGYAVYYELSYSASCVAGNMTPAATTAPVRLLTDSTGVASLTITNAFPLDTCAATVTWTGAATNPSSTNVITWQKSNPTTAISSPAGNYQALRASSNTVSWTIVDQFGNVVAGVPVQVALSGANAPTVAIATKTTSTAGQISHTWTDAKASATATTDTISVSSVNGVALAAGKTGAVTVTYKATLDAVSTLEAQYQTSAITADTLVPATAIGGAAGLPVSTADQIDLTGTFASAPTIAGSWVKLNFTALDAARVAVTGVPTTVTVTGAQLINSLGKLGTERTIFANEAIYVLGTKTGTATVTAKNGSLTATATINFSNVAGDARVISAKESNGLVTVTVTDAFANAVSGVSVEAIGSGGAWFGNGATSATFTTTADGTVTFAVTGGGTVTARLASAAKSGNLAGAGNATGTVLTPGAPAGVRSVSVTTAGQANSAEAAADAAAEAIDAANAATDAANLAAEAADAATVAAEEARDAADAATAAVEELGTQVATLMAALRAQITTLANTVAKIAKKVRA